MIKSYSLVNVQLGNGTVQMNTFLCEDNGHQLLAFKSLKTPYSSTPYDHTKTLEENGYTCLLEFGTVDSIENLIRLLNNMRDEMKEREYAKD